MEDKERSGNGYRESKKHPEEEANFLSKLFFCWIFPLYVKGYKNDLTEDDLYSTLKCHESKRLGDKLELAWTVERKVHKNPSLWRPIIQVFGKEFLLYGLYLIPIEFVFKLSQPLFIGKVLDYFRPNQTAVSTNEAYIYSSLIIIMSFLRVLTNHWVIFYLLHLGMKMRVACCSLIYRKALKLKKNVLAENNVGKLVNMLSSDVSRFDHALPPMHYLWLAPVQVLLVAYFLYDWLGISAVAGVVVIIFLLPIQMLFAAKVAQYRGKVAAGTDTRVRIIGEIITGIQVIKMYTWEKPFSKLVSLCRQSELQDLKLTYAYGIGMLSFRMFAMKICMFVSVLVYTLMGNEIESKYLYVLVSFHEILRQSILIYFSVSIMFTASLEMSVERIKDFLTLDDLNGKNTKTNIFKFQAQKSKIDDQSDSIISLAHKKICQDDKSEASIEAKCLFTRWRRDTEKHSKNSFDNVDYSLKNINVKMASGQLISLIGPVGSGKTTLLHVFLNELPVLHGSLEISGSLSYASQEPWLFNSSIKQNILFGQEYNEKRYLEVVKVCALEPDFEIFPFGDRTIIGERGVMLSGGQKARINLARAVYKEADIYLLDDPLSAVDTHVGRQLFQECIVGFLKNKCVLLVTHQLQYLKSVDQIYLLEQGRVTSHGNYNEIFSKSGGEFLKFLSNGQDDDHEITSNDASADNNKLSNNNADLPKEVEEQRSFGRISKKVYVDFLKSGGGSCLLFSVVLWFFISQLTYSLGDYFINIWVNVDQDRELNSTSPYFRADIEDFLSNINCLYIYTAFIIALLISVLVRLLVFNKFYLNIARNLHNAMFNKIVRSTMRFFNTNASGRILNRFSKDIYAIDESLTLSLMECLQTAVNTLAIIVFVAMVNVWVLIPAVAMMALFYSYRNVFLRTTRDLKRLEGTTKSPVFSHLTASLQGLTTIRAFGAEGILETEFDKFQNVHSSSFYMFMNSHASFGFWLDFHCVIYAAMVMFSFFLVDTEYSGNVGFAITQSMALMGMLQWGMKNWSDLDTQMTSVERVLEYTQLPSEVDLENKKPPENWPSAGTIQFQNVSMQYSPTEPHVLNNITFTIKAGEKVGVVGRTGAGKTSLISALFRLAYIEGEIVIDGVNTEEISLKSLRSKISIIPQEPLLFSGTVRKNLDPFGEYDDSQLWEALEEVELKKIVSGSGAGLDSQVAEGGGNFSVGQRQLLCLVRAMIRNNRIVVLDEATSNIDLQSDELIQKTIKKKFADCTVLTVAHRLNTVMNSDKILVMDKGSVVEFDSPYNLLQNPEGVFHALVNNTGKTMAGNLRKLLRSN